MSEKLGVFLVSVPGGATLWPALDAVRDEYGITEVWHGACVDEHGRLRGADAGIDLWARARVGKVAMFPARWALYRKAGSPDVLVNEEERGTAA